MTKVYNPKEIEKKWQEYWYANKVFETTEDDSRKKFYGLIEFPYPSGAGLHVGHIRAFSSMEVISRKRRLQGYNVLFPIGYDAFGLPTENYAIKTKQHPRIVTDNNIKKFETQLKAIGYSFDWDRTIDTTDEGYYKWTQWIFLQLFKKGLAYKSKTLVNFCPECKVVLANEESQNGVCDRCGSEVIQKEKDVWFLRIRNYADRLLEGLTDLDFLEKIKVEQQNWIGKSCGAEVEFTIKGGGKEYPLVVYTTRPDTIYGATFLVVSPEHPMIQSFAGSIGNFDEIRDYQQQAKLKKEFERVHLAKEKSGVRIDGITAVNPITGCDIPVFTADYVMMDYGTGAIMAVPAHDTRDYEFAKKYSLPIIEVIKGGDIEKEAYIAKDGGIMVNSGFLNGLSVPEAIDAMTAYMKKLGVGTPKTDFKMKDWAFNRQRYWGEPIPIINCPKCGQVPMDEKDLPLVLPKLEDFSPTDDASSPLSKVTEWVNTTCPVCGGPATRETDTMPQWAGSSWYYLRYMSPRDGEHVVNPEAYKYWGQVDWYNGGMEHVTRHLIYSRFWNMFLYDIGVVTNAEPYLRRSAQGLILGADGEKMSKSRNNVVNPDDVIKEYGADVLRLFTLFIGDYEKSAPWNPDAIKGCSRFLNKLWNLMDIIKEGDVADVNIDLCIKKVDDDFESLKFNTAIAQVMSTVNDIYQRGYVTKSEFKKLLIILNPIVPHITSEIYEIINGGAKIERQKWPSYDESKLAKDEVDIPVQLNGKLKGRITVSATASREDALEAVNKSTGILEGKNIIKVIYVEGKIINIVAR
ncbi:MAG: leucine--tRNA ligase [Clostridia bacterium]|nr:leucine--tRNA ligase [Clostridia bacterium]